MKRLGPCRELIHDRPLLLVGRQRTLVGGDLAAQRIEAAFHDIGRGFGIGVVDGEFEQLSCDEPAFDGAGLGAGQKAGFRLDLEHPQCGLISRGEKINVQGMSARPINQLLGRITPAETERRFEDRLSGGMAAEKNSQCGEHDEDPGNTVHGTSLNRTPRFRKTRSPKAFALLEVAVSLSLLTVLGLALLKLSLNVLHPRQWALGQALSDAAMTYERAYAQRVPFEVLAPAAGSPNVSPWPVYPLTTTSTVSLGRLPGGRAVTGTVIRSRTADPLNYTTDGGTGTVATNPAGVKTWRLQSVLSYRIGDREYLKSRTVIRTQ